MRNFRILFALVLLALVPVSGAWSATSRSSKAGVQKTAQATALPLHLQILRRLWVGSWTKIGCRLDPLGQCLPDAFSTPQDLEGGCGLDPLGRCLPGH
jgi:hypothetical protein